MARTRANMTLQLSVVLPRFARAGGPQLNVRSLGGFATANGQRTRS